MFELFCLVLEYRDRYPRLSSTQTTSPRSQSLYQCMKIYLHKYWFTGKLTLHLEGSLGSIKNHKTIGKNHPKPQNRKKIIKNRKPHAKPLKPKNFHIPVIKTIIDPIQSWRMEQNGDLRLWEIGGGEKCRSDWRGTRTQIGKTGKPLRIPNPKTY